VVTAGTAVRETVELFRSVAAVEFSALYVSVDRMERGTDSKSALQELEDTLGLKVFPLVTVREIIDYLHGREINGNVLVCDSMKEKMEQYLETYGA